MRSSKRSGDIDKKKNNDILSQLINIPQLNVWFVSYLAADSKINLKNVNRFFHSQSIFHFELNEMIKSYKSKIRNKLKKIQNIELRKGELRYFTNDVRSYNSEKSECERRIIAAENKAIIHDDSIANLGYWKSEALVNVLLIVLIYIMYNNPELILPGLYLLNELNKFSNKVNTRYDIQERYMERLKPTEFIDLTKPGAITLFQNPRYWSDRNDYQICKEAKEMGVTLSKMEARASKRPK